MRIYKFQILFFALTASLFTSCKKTDYLDIDAGDRPALSAKVKFINARQSVTAVNFWDFTRKVTATALQRNTATGYLDTQYGKVQFNLTEGTDLSYKASYIFGGSANFVQETNSASFAGPNGPIANFAHSLFTVKKKLTSTLNPGNIDSLILVYDDLTLPAAGKAKIRFANFSPDAPKVDLTYATGTEIFAGVAYGNFGNQTVISYTSGKAPAVIEGLSWKTLGPFKEVDAGTNLGLLIKDNTTKAVIALTNTALNAATFEAGKIYTVYINGTISGTPSITATIITHN
ncbi:DUF4397 domain-containing protein [Pedobacter miscanthi]|jgi:hypothetical protein|uniref:DUF4397 domain-containing protein n=1 Tax=Pedobacter miscanthi TaxID=2259170 RepID=UPI0029309C27|nr:DUF4397 domain-containing protein [Pedobacter miscanthi]